MTPARSCSKLAAQAAVDKAVAVGAAEWASVGRVADWVAVEAWVEAAAAKATPITRKCSCFCSPHNNLPLLKRNLKSMSQTTKTANWLCIPIIVKLKSQKIPAIRN